MPYLIESNEWRLLQRLGQPLSQRKALYQVKTPYPLGNHGTAELLEIELRRLFMVKTYPQNLESSVFQQCQANLSRLCSLLNDLAEPRIVNKGPPGQTHPRLRALAEFLETTTGAVDLVAGPNQTIFSLPQDPGKVRRRLDIVTKCNNELDLLLEPPPQESVIPSALMRQQSKTAWKKARVRVQASLVLGKLFEHFRCEASHEVLLKLIEDFDEHSTLPSLQLMLSPCHKPEPWQEVLCDFSNLSETEISSILNICADRQQYSGQGMSLMLLIQEYALFGAWGGNAGTSYDVDGSRQSLDQLIRKGAFKRNGLNTYSEGALKAEFGAEDKRALAVKLGYCLMDFFDVDVGSNMVYFLRSSTTSELDKDYPYLAFGLRLPATADSYNNFELGHPTLLSFAKLLLEIDFGEPMKLDIKPHNNQNEGAWLELVKRVDKMELERDGSYVQAVRGCLMVHQEIAKALRSRKRQNKRGTDSTIRKKLYKEVVRKLEGEVAQSIPRPAHKRQRSESPTPPDHSVVNPTASQDKMAVRSKVPSTFKDFKEYKKRRILEAKRSPSPASSYSSIGQPSTWSGRASSTDNSETRSFPRHLSSLRKFPRPSQTSPSISCRDAQPPQRPLCREDFEIAIICALPLEYNAVSYLFDEFWDDHGDQYGRAAGDPNSYTTGRMGNYNVVLALLPHMGKVNAAGAAASMRGSYSSLRLALLVGVCGAAPYTQKDEILLGDVIISKTVVQHDFGRQYENGFIRKETTGDSLGRANKDIRNLVAILETDRGNDWLKDRTAQFLEKLQDEVALKRPGKYDHPGLAKDKLYKTHYRHKHHKSKKCVCRSHTGGTDPVCDEALDSSCANLGCDEKYLVERNRLRALKQNSKQESKRISAPPAVHVGAVASGDGVIKSAAYRDMMSKDAGVIAFEMEGAGVWDEVPSIVVKGVCDYADSHKNKDWQDFAAATAASACKAILERYIRTDKVAG